MFKGPHCAPALLISIINMAMLTGKPYGWVDNKECVNSMPQNTSMFADYDTENKTCDFQLGCNSVELPNCQLAAWYPGQVRECRFLKL